MRTTITLDPDVARLLHERQYLTKKSFKEVVNEAIRAALRPSPRKSPKLIPPKPMGLRTGIDPRTLSSLADDLEAEAYLGTASRPR
ncbi:MAG: hypothetical protein WCG66_12210 [bacterium]